MANKVKSKLSTLNSKLAELKASVLAGKREIAYAIKYNGITTVHPYEDTDYTYSTFSQLAQLIRKLKASNSMILEFQIPNDAATNYKRTIVLPLYFGSGYAPSSLNAIAKEIIAMPVPQVQPLMDMGMPMTMDMGFPVDGGVPVTQEGDFYVPETATDEEIANATPVEVVTFPDPEHEGDEENFGGVGVDDGFILDPEMPVIDEDIPYIIDVYGNECIDGNYVPTMREIETYLSDEQQLEMLSAMAELGITTEEGEEVGGIAPMSLSAPMTLAANAPATHAEQINEANYEYVVNWGDDTNPCEYHAGASYEENKAAMWHTYAQPGIYDVTITGNFRRIHTSGDEQSALVENNDYIYDTDGTYKIINANNYAMRNYLISVISWGNTLLTKMDSAFRGCSKLATIPMYDTSNSFEDVTTFSYAFRRCTALKEIPFNSNTNKGLFSGCKKVTDFSAVFRDCTGLTGRIPVKLFDGCPNVTTMAAAFAYAKCSGDIPNGLLEGMTSLTDASEMFASCSLSGELSADMFKDCPNLTRIYRLFYGCTGVTGTIQREFIGSLSKLTDMRQAFYGCTGITGIASDAFYNLRANGINARQMFYNCTGIPSIPDGLFDNMTGTGLMLEKMFDRCTGITSIDVNAVKDLKVANARGMFGGCTGMNTIIGAEEGETPTFLANNSDWNSFDTMQKWYGAFARTGLTNADGNTIHKELGGKGARKFTNAHVGKIVLANTTPLSGTAELPTDNGVNINGHRLVEVEDYVYSSTNKPIGWVYADVFLDSDNMKGKLSNSAGNLVARDTAGAVHKLYVSTWSDTTRTWTSAQNLCEDLDTITNTNDTAVAYNTWVWSGNAQNGFTQSLRATRYNGEAYSLAILEFLFKKGNGVNDYVQGGLYGSYTSYQVVDAAPTTGIDATKIYYVKDTTDPYVYHAWTTQGGANLKLDEGHDFDLHTLASSRYPAISYCNSYSYNGLNSGTCFLPDATDEWDLWVMREWMQKACQKIQAGGGGFTSSNCFPYRDGTWYWASAEYSSAASWNCGTDNSGVYGNGNFGKWASFYVRPSFALAVA